MNLYIFPKKNFEKIYSEDQCSDFLDIAAVKGGGWVFRGVGPGRGEAKNLKLAREDASNKRYDTFYIFFKFSLTSK